MLNKSNSNMKQFHRLKFLLAFFLLFACVTPFVSAFSVSSMSVDPSGSLTPGTPVIVTFKVDFSASGKETFPSANELLMSTDLFKGDFSASGKDTFPPDNELQMSTDLDSPTWSYSLVLDGVDTLQPSNTGRILSVSGWVLSYPTSAKNPSIAKTFESLKVTLEGKAPAVSQTTKNIIKIAEYDSHSNVISSSVITQQMPVASTPTPTPTHESPIGIEAGIIATIGAALLIMKRI
jgi:hypothetical protein